MLKVQERKANKPLSCIFYMKFYGGDCMDPREEIKRLNKMLKKIKGNDPISRARKQAILLAIYRLQQEEVGP